LALKYANNWLAAQGIQAADIKQNMCAYCHTELAPPEVVSVVKRQGYFIIDLTG
jgi:predicted  nucleic acid-binding Zn-ribbon protein